MPQEHLVYHLPWLIGSFGVLFLECFVPFAIRMPLGDKRVLYILSLLTSVIANGIASSLLYLRKSFLRKALSFPKSPR